MTINSAYLQLSYLRGTLTETRHTIFQDTYISGFNHSFNTVQIMETLIEKGSIIWLPHHRPNLNFDVEDSKYWNCYGSTSNWHNSKSSLSHQLRMRNIESSEDKVPNFFLLWLLDKKIKLMNGERIDPEKFLFEDGFAVMNCADIIFFTLYICKIMKKAEICENYMKEFELYANPQKQRTHYYGLEYRHLIDVSDATQGDLILVFNNEKKPIHLCLKGYGDIAMGLWTMESKDILKGKSFFPHSFSLTDFMRKHHTLQLACYPLDSLIER